MKFHRPSWHRYLVFSLLTGSLCWICACSHNETPLSISDMLGAIPPKSPKEALHSFQLEPGFHLELAAGEPEVVDPIDITWNEKGWMYVAEFRDYPNGPFEGKRPESRIRLLKDVDNDGYYESSTVFAEHIHWASSVCVWRNGIFVAAPPEILYFKDLNGDDVADQCDTIYTGFGTRASEDLLNNLKLGFDGWIYGAASYNGGEVYSQHTPKEKTSVRRRDFRFHPDTYAFEAISSGDGDFGNCFDDWGRRFVTNANHPLIHVVLPAKYVDRNPYYTPSQTYQSVVQFPDDWIYQISPPEQWRVIRGKYWEQYVNTNHDMRARRYSVKELAEGNYITGTAGGTIYRGARYPAEYKGTIFSAEPAANLVMHAVPKTQGASYTAGRPHAEEREFLAATDNWFRPVNFANGPDGNLYICDMYREYIEDPSAIPPDILKHMDMHSGSDRGRIWRIVYGDTKASRIFRFDSEKALVEAMKSANSWHRETAHRLILERDKVSLLPSLTELIEKGELAEIRVQALWTVFALGGLSPKLIEIALDDAHAGVRETAVRLVGLLDDMPAPVLKKVARKAEDPNLGVRLHVALTLGGWRHVDAIPPIYKIVQQKPLDQWMQKAILTMLPMHQLPLFTQILENPSHIPLGFLEALANNIGKSNESQAILSAIQVMEQHQHSLVDSSRISLLLHIFEGAKEGRISPRHFAAFQSYFDTVIQEATYTLKASDTSIPHRRKALRLVSLFTNKEDSSLFSLLNPSEPPEIQAEAIQALLGKGDLIHAGRLVNNWGNISPSARETLLDELVWDSKGISLLLKAIEEGRIPAREFSQEKKQRISLHPDLSIQQKAKHLFSIDTTENLNQKINRYLKARLVLEPHPKAGKNVFIERCASCHKVGGAGKSVGPSLLQTGDRSPEAMLVHILDPDRSVSPQFAAYLVTTQEGKNLMGIISEEAPSSITLKLPGGAVHQVPRAQIKSLKATHQSLMPVGLDQGLTDQQMVDLLAFLERPIL